MNTLQMIEYLQLKYSDSTFGSFLVEHAIPIDAAACEHGCRPSAEVRGAAIGLTAAIPALPAVEDAARASATEALLDLLGPAQPSTVQAAALLSLGTIQPCLDRHGEAPASSGTSGLAARVKSTLLQLLRQFVPEANDLAAFVSEVVAAEGLPMHVLEIVGRNGPGQDPALVEACFAGEAANHQAPCLDCFGTHARHAVNGQFGV